MSYLEYFGLNRHKRKRRQEDERQNSSTVGDSWKCDHCTIQITNSPYNDLPLAYSTSRRKSVGFYCIKYALRTSITDGTTKGSFTVRTGQKDTIS